MTLFVSSQLINDKAFCNDKQNIIPGSLIFFFGLLAFVVFNESVNKFAFPLDKEHTK